MILRFVRELPADHQARPLDWLGFVLSAQCVATLIAS